MRLYNCLLALAGDTGNTVPKANITAAEIALLQAIHGSDAVTDIDRVNLASTGFSSASGRSAFSGPIVPQNT